MKVLITGGAGFIGSHTADLLLQNGYEVRVIDNLLPPVHRQRRKPDYLPTDIDFILGDVCNRDDMTKALDGVDAVFHLAAYQGYMPDFGTFAYVNDFSTALLYEIIVSNRLPVQKVVVASSQAIYGEAKYECNVHGVQYPSPRPLNQLENGDWEARCSICEDSMSPFPIDESIVNPHNQYAVSKYSQELYSMALGKRYAIPTVALRYSITQGPRQSFSNAYSGILRIFALRLLNGLSPVAYEDGRQLRDYVYVGDVAAANMLVLESDAANYEVFNVGGNEVLSVSEYAELLLGVTRRKDISVQMPGEFRFGDTRHVISDISKLRHLGWEPIVPVKYLAMEYVSWAQDQPEASDHYAVAQTTMKEAGAIKIVVKQPYAAAY